MIYILPLLVAFCQDPSLAEGSRKLFSPLIEFVVENDKLTIKGTASKEQILAALEDIADKLPVGRGTCQSPNGSQTWGLSRLDSHADISFNPLDRPDSFSWSYVTSGASETVELRQTEPGVIRLVVDSEKSMTYFTQRKDGQCVLVVFNGNEAVKWKVGSFNALLLESGDAAAEYVLAPLERYFDHSPLSPFSTEVIELAISVGPLSRDVAREIGALVNRLSDNAIDVRAAAEVELCARTAKSAPVLHEIARQIEISSDAALKASLTRVVRSVPRRHDAYLVMVRGRLYRDLSYLVRLMAAGRPARPRLEALTGLRFETHQEWSKWIEVNLSKLRWNEVLWKYEK